MTKNTPFTILLVDPPHKIFGGLRMWMPSPGLMALGAYLEREGTRVEIFDATVQKNPWSDLAARLEKDRYDLVGVTCQAATFHKDALRTVRLVKRILPECLVIGGGGHFSLNHSSMFKECPEVDGIVVGEGERTFWEVVERAGRGEDLSGIKGLAVRRNGQTVFPGPRELIEDLDELPMPGYHLVEMDNPVYFLHGMGRRAVGISTSRGCGDKCSYCSESMLWNARWRGRSGPLVVEEMEMLASRYNRSLFVFNENSFNQSRKRNEDFLESLGRSGLKCDFWFQSRVRDILRDRDLLPEFKRLGLYEIMLGVESISPKTLKNYTKSQSLEQILEAVDLLRSHGIMVMTNIMFGDVEDTEEILSETYDLVSRIGDFLVLTLTTPLPGTRYYETAHKQDRILERDYSKYDFMHPVMRNQYYSPEEIMALQKKYLRKYYTRPAVFAKMLFSPNRFIRMAYRLIMRHAWYEARNREWVQKNFQQPPAFLTEAEE